MSKGYLTSRQKLIWNLKYNGLPESAIAKKLKVNRQTVHKTLCTANVKVYISLKEVAILNKIKIEIMDPARGLLVGYDPHFKTKVIITFSEKNGIQIWHKHKGDCKNCDQLHFCKKTLLTEAKDRNITLSKNDNLLLPSELAETLFLKILGEKE